MHAQFAQDNLHLPDKHATIPDIVTILQVALGGRAVGLFHEMFAGEGLVPEAFADLFSVTNIAVAGLRCRRCDAQCHQVALISHFMGQVQRPSECLSLANHVISWQRYHHSFRVLARDRRGDPGNSGRGVAPHWFAQDVSVGQAGRCSSTSSAMLCPVTTHVCSDGTSGATRASVSCIILFPLGSGRNCLGKLGVLKGQRRVPLPPARITTFRWFIPACFLAKVL